MLLMLRMLPEIYPECNIHGNFSIYESSNDTELFAERLGLIGVLHVRRMELLLGWGNGESLAPGFWAEAPVMNLSVFLAECTWPAEAVDHGIRHGAFRDVVLGAHLPTIRRRIQAPQCNGVLERPPHCGSSPARVFLPVQCLSVPAKRKAWEENGEAAHGNICTTVEEPRAPHWLVLHPSQQEKETALSFLELPMITIAY
jgi:hypothetical protein